MEPGDRPLAAGGGAEATAVEVHADAAQGLAGEHQLRRLPQDRRLLGNDRDLVGRIAVAAKAAAMWPAMLGQLRHLAADALGAVLALVARPGAERAGHGAPSGGLQVQLSRPDGLDVHAVGIAQVDELLQLARGPMQAVGVPGDDRAHLVRSDVLQEATVFRPVLAGVRADVVVHVHPNDAPSPLARERFAVRPLALHLIVTMAKAMVRLGRIADLSLCYR